MLFNCFCPIPCYCFFVLYYCTNLCHSREPFSIPLSLLGLSQGVLTGVVMGCCQRSPPLSASTSVSSASLMVECQKETRFLWDVIHLPYILIWTASVNHTKTSASSVSLNLSSRSFYLISLYHITIVYLINNGQYDLYCLHVWTDITVKMNCNTSLKSLSYILLWPDIWRTITEAHRLIELYHYTA